MELRWTVTSFCVLVVATSCRAPAKPSDLDTTAVTDDSLDRARARWNASRTPAYEFVFSTQCFCPPDARRAQLLVVRGERIESRTYADNGSVVDSTRAGIALTIDGLFAKLLDARARKAARIDVSYHPTLGYPTRMYIDYSTSIADEEVGHEARDLRARP